jgi:HEPN domain-containing protein
MDLRKQIDYWRDGSDEDMEVAREIIANQRYRHALFLAHLALEKIIKAHVTKTTNEVPPRIHNLRRLAKVAGISLPQTRDDFLREFDRYQTEGRYPFQLPTIDPAVALQDFAGAEEMKEWFKNQL